MAKRQKKQDDPPIYFEKLIEHRTDGSFTAVLKFHGFETREQATMIAESMYSVVSKDIARSTGMEFSEEIQVQ